MPFIWRVRVLVASINTEPGKEGAVRVFCHFIATFSLVVKATHFRDLTDTPEALGGAYAPPTCVVRTITALPMRWSRYMVYSPPLLMGIAHPPDDPQRGHYVTGLGRD